MNACLCMCKNCQNEWGGTVHITVGYHVFIYMCVFMCIGIVKRNNIVEVCIMRVDLCKCLYIYILLLLLYTHIYRHTQTIHGFSTRTRLLLCMHMHNESHQKGAHMYVYMCVCIYSKHMESTFI